MKNVFLFFLFFLICAIGKGASDANRPSGVSDSNMSTPMDANTEIDCQAKIKKLEKALESLQKKLSKLSVEYSKTKKELDEQVNENERLRALLQQKENESIPLTVLSFTGDETPLTVVKAYLEEYVGKTIVIIGSVEVSSASYDYRHNYEGKELTHVCLSFTELNTNVTSTGNYMDLFVKKEISSSLVAKIAINENKGLNGKIIRAKVSFPSPYDPSGCLQAELINWQFLSEDKTTWKSWAMSEQPIRRARR